VAQIYGEYLNIVGLGKTKSITSGFSLFNSNPSQPATEMQSCIVTGDKPVTKILSNFTDVPYYFEVTVLKPGNMDESGISIGFVEEHHNLKGILGQTPGSYGYDVFKQKIYGPKLEPNKSFPGQPRTVGTYGCGWDHKEGLIFFMGDGFCGGTFFRGIGGPLVPAVCLSSGGAEVTVNFGTSPYCWDVSRFWKPFRETESKFEQCISEAICTFNATGTNYFPQLMFGCKTCRLTGNYGMCEVCATVCHAGHDIVIPRLAPGFFCDCGHLSSEKTKDFCKCLKKNH